MGSFSIWHWMVVLLVVLLLFGGGKVSSLMGDFASGIKAFKKNMADEPEGAKAADPEKPGPSLPGATAEAGPEAAKPATAQRETTAAH